MAFSIADTFAGKISLTVLSFILTLANVVVVFAYATNRRLRSLANRFVVSLAISDLVVSCILVPIMAWKPQSKMADFIISFSLLASLTNICGCTFDRYNAIKNPLLYTSIMTKNRFIKVMVAIWTIPAIIALVPQIWVINPSALNMDADEVGFALRIYVGVMTFLVLLACLVLFVVYVYIFRVAKQHYDAIKRAAPPRLPADADAPLEPSKKRDAVKKFVTAIKATVLFAIIGMNFLLCWLPLIITNVFTALNRNDLIALSFVKVGEILMYMNSLLNPIAYAFFQKEFRRSIKRFFRSQNAVGTSDTSFYSNPDGETRFRKETTCVQ